MCAQSRAATGARPKRPCAEDGDRPPRDREGDEVSGGSIGRTASVVVPGRCHRIRGCRIGGDPGTYRGGTLRPRVTSTGMALLESTIARLMQNPNYGEIRKLMTAFV